MSLGLLWQLIMLSLFYDVITTTDDVTHILGSFGRKTVILRKCLQFPYLTIHFGE